jgi:hypothetical protein
MSKTIRRAATVLGATAGIVALSTSSAFAHYCYRTDVPEGSKAANGQAWATKAEMTEMLAGFLPPECYERVADHIEAMPADTLFMGPGLLAAGAVRNGQAPDGVGHLFEDARDFEECAVLFQG